MGNIMVELWYYVIVSYIFKIIFFAALGLKIMIDFYKKKFLRNVIGNVFICYFNSFGSDLKILSLSW